MVKSFVSNHSPRHSFRMSFCILNRRALLKAAALWVLLCSMNLPAAQISTDVVVYGATPSGVCAAIGAAREGVSVALVEPTAHIGGVNTGGLAFSDSNQMAREALRGLFEEFHFASRGLQPARREAALHRRRKRH